MLRGHQFVVLQDATAAAARQYKFLLVYLHAAGHDDTPRFCRETLTAPEVRHGSTRPHCCQVASKSGLRMRHSAQQCCVSLVCSCDVQVVDYVNENFVSWAGDIRYTDAYRVSLGVLLDSLCSMWLIHVHSMTCCTYVSCVDFVLHSSATACAQQATLLWVCWLSLARVPGWCWPFRCIGLYSQHSRHSCSGWLACIVANSQACHVGAQDGLPAI